MEKWILCLVPLAVMGAPATAATITLQSVAASGSGEFTFSYQGTLGPDEGLRSGDRLIIFDFAGYVDGSIVSPYAEVLASVENVSSDIIMTPGQSDDPNLPNLVFTYNGPDFQAAGGPFAAISFNGLSARSVFGATGLDAFFAQTTKNNPPAEAVTAAYQLGLVRVPGVPEPATWAMMIGGFGLAGATLRRRSRRIYA